MVGMTPIPEDVAATFDKIVVAFAARGDLAASRAREALNRVWNAETSNGIKSNVSEWRDPSGDSFYMARMTHQKSRNGYRWKVELEFKRC